MKKFFLTSFCILAFVLFSFGQGTRLLRQPTLSKNHIAFTYGGDLWVTNLANQQTRRLTNTGAVESDPYFSPDGKTIAFSSNRSGMTAVYIVSVEGGTPTRLTWYPSEQGSAAGLLTANVFYIHLPGKQHPTATDGCGRFRKTVVLLLLTQQWGYSGSFSPDGKQIVIDRVSRWDKEWRDYRGGQNTPLEILTLKTGRKNCFPTIKPWIFIRCGWAKPSIFFPIATGWKTSGRIHLKPKELKQLTHFTGSDIKWLAGSAINWHLNAMGI